MEKFEWGIAAFGAAAMWLLHPIPSPVTPSLCLFLPWQTRLNCKYSSLLSGSALLKQSCWGFSFPLFSASGWTLVPTHWVTQGRCPSCSSLSPPFQQRALWAAVVGLGTDRAGKAIKRHHHIKIGLSPSYIHKEIFSLIGRPLKWRPLMKMQLQHKDHFWNMNQLFWLNLPNPYCMTSLFITYLIKKNFWSLL